MSDTTHFFGDGCDGEHGRAVQRPNSPECRYAANPEHLCRRRDGRITVGDEPCWDEARAQIMELAAERFAEPVQRHPACRGGRG